LNVVDGCIPSDRATGTLEEIEEERRLLYVASTRAKDELDLIAPHRFFTHQQAKLGDRHVYESRSRFIQDSILGSFATRNWRDQTDSQIEAAGRKAQLPVGQRLKISCSNTRARENFAMCCGRPVPAICRPPGMKSRSDALEDLFASYPDRTAIWTRVCCDPSCGYGSRADKTS
jgi:succinate dehydrogenase flavin-adding protein (antitoxin of CptAB toxin-antitoxin module)